MVEADAQARQEIITVHRDLQAERATLSTAHEALETERKQIAQQRRTESMLVPAAKMMGGAAVAVVVVLFCLALLIGLRRGETTDADVNELLISELVSEHPRLLAEPRRLDRSTPPLLTAADETIGPNPQGDPE